jgi:chromosome segregation ATPase
MELEQLAKRVAWLDDERRKDKHTIVRLEEKITILEGRIGATETEKNDLSGEVTRLRANITRLDQLDASIVQQRTEFNRQLKDFEHISEQRDTEITNLLRTEIQKYENPISEIRKEVDDIRVLRRDMQARVLEETRLGRLLDELGNNLDDLRVNEEEQSRIYRLLEDGRRQDTRRLTDLQGEVGAIRKRSDEQRGQQDVIDLAVKRLETRLNELVNAEQERMNAQTAYLEKQALVAVERETAWKEWQSRFNIVEKQSVDVENQLQSLDATFMAVKRTQDAVDDLMQRVERRINEVAEIQRLAEERFRQEWTTFKADDQKRWTNYTLSQDEQRGEVGRRFERITERLTYTEDNLQDVQDLLQQVNDMNARHMQTILTTMHEWSTAYERTNTNLR